MKSMRCETYKQKPLRVYAVRCNYTFTKKDDRESYLTILTNYFETYGGPLIATRSNSNLIWEIKTIFKLPKLANIIYTSRYHKYLLMGSFPISSSSDGFILSIHRIYRRSIRIRSIKKGK